MELRYYIPTVRWQPWFNYWRIAPWAKCGTGQRWAHLWLGKLYIFWPWPAFFRVDNDDETW